MWMVLFSVELQVDDGQKLFGINELKKKINLETKNETI